MKKISVRIGFITSKDYRQAYNVFAEYGSLTSYAINICDCAEIHGIDLTSEEVVYLYYDEPETNEIVVLSQITLNALNEEIQIYLENKKKVRGNK